MRNLTLNLTLLLALLLSLSERQRDVVREQVTSKKPGLSPMTRLQSSD